MKPIASRRKELRRRLDEAGLPPLRAARTLRSRDVEARMTRLVPLLVRQGPLFVAFGHYLSHRPDLFSWESCQTLAKARAPRTPLSALEATELLRRRLGRLPTSNELQVAWDRPHRQLLGQWHKGFTGDGTAVVVRLLDPAIEQSAPAVIQLLPTLFERVPILSPGSRRPSVIATFADWLQRELDLPRQAAVLESLHQMQGNGDPTPARVLGPLTGPGIITHERLTTAEEDAPPVVSLHHWLRTALLHGVVSLDWIGEAPWLPLSQSRLGIVRGPFYSLDVAERSTLREYLAAVAADDPGRACAALESLLKPTRHADRIGLRDGLRRIVPFRDTQWPGPPDSIGGTVIAHWRLVEASGFSIDPPVERFFAGLAIQWQRVVDESPETDSLRTANEWLRADELLVALGRFLDPSALTSWTQAQAAPLSQLPAQIDRRLDQMLRQARGPQEVAGTDSATRQGGAVGLSVALLFAALLLLAELLPGAGGFAAWTHAAMGLAVAGVGALMIRNILRG